MPEADPEANTNGLWQRGQIDGRQRYHMYLRRDTVHKVCILSPPTKTDVLGKFFTTSANTGVMRGDQHERRMLATDGGTGDNTNDEGTPTPIVPDTASNRLVERRDPVPQSTAGLLSRDYQPRTGGPELIASWPLGTPPEQDAPGGDPWRIRVTDYVQLQRNLTVNHFLGPIEYTKLYLGVRGRGHVENGGSLTLKLEQLHLEGEEYETQIDLTNDSGAPFITPMVECTPDARDYREHSFIGREMYGGYVLSAKITSGTGYLDQGTAVHLWSE